MSKKLDGSKLVDLVSEMPNMAVPMVQLPRRWKIVDDGETSHVVLNDLNLANMLADVGVVKNLSSEKSLPLLQDVKVSVKNGSVVAVQERRLTLVAVGRGDFSFKNVPKEEWEEAVEEMVHVAEMDLKFLNRFNELFSDMGLSLEERVTNLEDNESEVQEELSGLQTRVDNLESRVDELEELQDACSKTCSSSCDEDSSEEEDEDEDEDEDESCEDEEDEENW